MGKLGDRTRDLCVRVWRPSQLVGAPQGLGAQRSTTLGWDVGLLRSDLVRFAEGSGLPPSRSAGTRPGQQPSPQRQRLTRQVGPNPADLCCLHTGRKHTNEQCHGRESRQIPAGQPLPPPPPLPPRSPRVGPGAGDRCCYHSSDTHMAKHTTDECVELQRMQAMDRHAKDMCKQRVHGPAPSGKVSKHTPGPGRRIKFGEGGLSRREASRPPRRAPRSPEPRPPGGDRRRAASVEKGGLDIVMSETGNPRLVRVAPAPVPSSSPAMLPSHTPLSCRSTSRARRSPLQAVLWCGVFLGFLALAHGQASGALALVNGQARRVNSFPPFAYHPLMPRFPFSSLHTCIMEYGGGITPLPMPPAAMPLPTALQPTLPWHLPVQPVLQPMLQLLSLCCWCSLLFLLPAMSAFGLNLMAFLQGQLGQLGQGLISWKKAAAMHGGHGQVSKSGRSGQVCVMFGPEAEAGPQVQVQTL